MQTRRGGARRWFSTRRNCTDRRNYFRGCTPAFWRRSIIQLCWQRLPILQLIFPLLFATTSSGFHVVIEIGCYPRGQDHRQDHRDRDAIYCDAYVKIARERVYELYRTFVRGKHGWFILRVYVKKQIDQRRCPWIAPLIREPVWFIRDRSWPFSCCPVCCKFGPDARQDVMQGRTGTPMCRITGGFGRHLNSAECEEIPFGHNPQKRSGRPVDLALQPSFRGMLVSGSRQQQKFQICWCWPGIMRFERKFRSCRDEYPVAGIQSRDTALDVARRPVLIGFHAREQGGRQPGARPPARRFALVNEVARYDIDEPMPDQRQLLRTAASIGALP